MASNKMDKITSRDVDFSQWYTDVIKNSNLIDYGPVKGTTIYKPYGFAVWENIKGLFDLEFKKLGVDNVYFPLLIPESLMIKEKKHVEGFAPELWTVTQTGNTQLAEKLFIRPTSEVMIADHWAKEIRSHRDLPLKYNQWVNVMRAEKTTRPFLRGSEFLWQEGHTVHAYEAEAKKMTKDILDVYSKISREKLMIPVITGEKTENERFAGAEATYTIEAMMYDGQALQSGTSHYLGQNFTKGFDIKFQNKSQKEEHAYSTSWGVSTRIIGAIIMSHSDDFGLVLPSAIAPIQVGIIKIKDTDEVLKATSDIVSKLSKTLRVNIDESDKSFGFKISEAEIKGIPIRIEVGPRDLENGSVTISRRDIRNKVSVKLADVEKYVTEQINEYDKNIFNVAKEHLEKRIYTADTFDEYQNIINTKSGFVLVPFCGEVSCEEDIKKKSSTNSRCIPDDVEQVESKCFNCGKSSKNKVYFARAY
ncbi:prolyl-tRNA synthetase [Spiroplasma sp. TIUS-1]|uniref:proline--tRNA ligase n=1 Tax=Spiroplasma sp. TIUS-1 TaxID=216963 RepID=UPI001398A218|nr:proline--tRNA ligase [Spiroplasma sp. TIUS-1]QHX35717.1 prolyl-tRNA synthetase [Spiroplasma sp. TIUS-1]